MAPAAVGSVGVGAATALAPFAGAGAGVVTLLTLMPWRFLFTLLCGMAILNRFRFDVATVTIQPAHLIVVPIALRVFLFTRDRVRPSWGLPEWALIGFIGTQLVSSAIYAEIPIRSFIVTGLLALGAITYFATFVGVFNRQRLIWAGRVLLIAAMVNALVADLAALAHYTLGTKWGVSTSGVGAPAAGLAQEYNILGGMAASAAIAFLVLMRERNPLFSRRFCVLSFWICFAALVASLTRGAWIAFIVALLAMLLVRRRVRPRRNRVAQIALTAMGLAVGLAAIYVVAAAPSDPSNPNAIVARGSRLLVFSEGSGANRVSEWQIALREVQRSPLLGLGTNSYGQRHEAPKKRPENAKGAFIGNLYIRTLYDSGVVGLAFLLAFLLSVEWPKRFLQRSTGDLAIVARTFVFMYFALGAAYVVTDASFQVWPWIVLGLARASRSHAFQQYLSLRMTSVGNGAAGNGAGGNGRSKLVGTAVPLNARGPATISIRRDDR